MKLRISESLSLPLEAVTQTFAILAVKGSGKSYTASVCAEEMLKAGQQIVVIDMTGAWYGLKSSADGKSDGFPIAVFGGDHADVPLDESAGEVIASAIVEKKFSAILDFSDMRKGQTLRFLAAFLETLYRVNRSPLHLFADEADAYVPQKVFGEQARTVGAMEDIVRRGRKKGIGCSMITQRPASINKDVLTQCEVLIALRMSHPRDIDAIKEWVNVHSSVSDAKDMIDSLPSLTTGNAYVWSPSWLKVFKKVQIRFRETFDSGATPKPGEAVKVPKKLAAIDIEKLGREISDTVQRKKAEDPKELKKRIYELEKQAKSTPVQKSEQVEVPVLKDAQIDRLNKMFDKVLNGLQEHGVAINAIYNQFTQGCSEIRGAIIAIAESKKIQKPIVAPQPRIIVPTKFAHANEGGSSDLPIGERKILTALIQFNKPLDRKQLTVLTGYKRSSRDAYIARLSQKGLVQSVGSGSVEATKSGKDTLGDVGQLPTGTDLQQYWLSQLPSGESVILKVLIGQYPNSVERDSLDSETGFKRSSRDAYLARLSAKELVVNAGQGLVIASENLF
jgi:hypothetical protein